MRLTQFSVKLREDCGYVLCGHVLHSTLGQDDVIEGFHALGPSLVFPTSMEPRQRREGKVSIEKMTRRLRVGQNIHETSLFQHRRR